MATRAPEQGALDLTAGYIPLPAQERFHRSTAKFRLYSGGFGSGKSMCGCREAIYKAWQHPGSSGGIFRLRQKDLELTTMKTFWEQLTAMGLNKKPFVKKWSAKLNELTFSNGSTILFSGLDDEMKLRSMSLSWAYVDEGSEVPVVMYRTLMGRIRFGTPRRLWVTTNPGASGWLRKNFIDEQKDGYDLFMAPTRENHHLDEDYIQSLLDEYPEIWVEQYLNGSWDVFEGQVFTQLSAKVHLIDAGNWKPQKHHLIYEGYDFGYRNPTHVTWTAWDPTGEDPLITFAEHSANEWTVDRHVSVIGQIRREWQLNPENIISFGDPAGAQVQGLTGQSYFDEYAMAGIGIAPSTKEPSVRAIRLAKLQEKRIKTRAGDDTPAHVFLKGHTEKTWASLINYRFKENRSQTGEDAKEQFHKENDHGVDSLGYGVMPIPLDSEGTDGRRPRPHAARPFRFDGEEEYEDDEEPTTLYGMVV